MTYTCIPLNDYYIIVSDGKYTKDTNWYLDGTNSVRKNVVIDEDYWNVREDYRKIIAQSKQVHDGIPLFDMYDEVEIEMVKLVDIKANKDNHIDINAYGNGIINGYNKAKETYKWTDEDLRIAFDDGCKFINFAELKSFLSKPKKYEVVIEMEIGINPNKFTSGIFWIPKVVNNKINILEWKQL